ncbi:MAG: efflux transporter outer membrane subunit [Verrucomicrobiae bacterium]|nr:efflux transporter outer membrane subunit [Verrucomicrobiae bacterium]
MNCALTFSPLFALLLGGCTVGTNYEGPPTVSHSGKFAGARSQAPAKVDSWWRQLGSRELNRFVDQAMDNNPDVAIAAQRLREARAMRKQVAGAMLPQAGANLSYSQLNPGSITGGGDFGGLGTGFSFSDPIKYWSSGVDISWEVDVFGGHRREARGARAREEAEQEALHGVRQALVAEVAEAYFTVASLRQQLSTLDEQISIQGRQTDDTRAKAEAGASSQLDLSRALARLEAIRTERPTLESGITAQVKRLALLLGQRPDALDGQRIADNAVPDKLPMTRIGVPAELILRRPDLRQSERELAAATEDIGVAMARFYPRFTIGATGPTSIGSEVGDLFDPAGYVWQFGPRVEWDLFKGGANRAILEQADARQKVALLGYEKAVLNAIGEVETELSNLQAETQRLAIVQRARRASSDAVRRVRESYDAGAAPQIDVLVEEQALREIDLSEIRVKAQMLQVWIRLHKALGGGWK